MATEPCPLAVLVKPSVTQPKPVQLFDAPVLKPAVPSSHWVVAVGHELGLPARNDDLNGYHIIREPHPVAGMMPIPSEPSATTPPALSTRKRSPSGEPERRRRRMSDWAV